MLKESLKTWLCVEHQAEDQLPENSRSFPPSENFSVSPKQYWVRRLAAPCHDGDTPWHKTIFWYSGGDRWRQEVMLWYSDFIDQNVWDHPRPGSRVWVSAWARGWADNDDNDDNGDDDIMIKPCQPSSKRLAENKTRWDFGFAEIDCDNHHHLHYHDQHHQTCLAEDKTRWA